MERFAPQLAFDLPSSSLNFDTFSKFPLPVVNTERNNSIAMVETTAAEKLLRKLSEQIGRELKSGGIIGGGAGVGGSAGDSSLSLIRNQIVLNGTGSGSVEDFNEFPSEDWIRQAEYDKFMNEIWIGIVLTLIVISMVFCICSCFLYHQFRQWKNNYHRNIQQNNDMESVKLSIEDDDLPSYTLVSGLPSYDAALEQLQRSATSNSCLLLYPSVFKIFTSNEKQDHQLCPLNDISSTASAVATTTTSALVIQQQYRNNGVAVPSYQEAMNPRPTMSKTEEAAAVPSYQEALLGSSGISNS